MNKQYRMDCDEKEDGEWWLEELTAEGVPTEDYIFVSDSELEILKANGQIWKYSNKLERWTKPITGNLNHA